jgi:YD repeat-containing protein
MTRKIATIVFAVMSLACFLIGNANAQNSTTYSCPLYRQIVNSNPASCLLTYGWNEMMGNPNLPAGLVTCNPASVPFGESGVALRPSCGSPASPGDICIGCLTAGAPINLSTGNTYIAQSDISIPGLGGGLRLSRTWNSMLPQMQNTYAFMFGVNWRSTYEERLIINSGDGYVKYLRADGSVWSFATYATGSPNVYKVAAPANDTTTTMTDGSPSWTMTAKNGEKRLFAAATGVLTSIIDRNGNTTQLSYDASNRLTTITDPASRHLTFTYVGPSSNLVSTVTSDVGITFSYAYDGQGRLTQVTKSDNTTISFVYDAQNRITAVKDSDGKILESHTYDVIGRGLTSSRANGVDSVTVTYPL